MINWKVLNGCGYFKIDPIIPAKLIRTVYILGRAIAQAARC